MIKETMTIHKALSELKILDARICKEVGTAVFSVPNKHANSLISGVPIQDFVDQAKDTLKSVKTLINRRNAIKRAVTRSNAVTVVNIGGNDYTVAEAIDMKNNGIEHLKVLCSTIETQYAAAKSAAERENGSKLEQRADTYVQSLYQGADKKNMSDEVRKVREDFMNAQIMEIVDPIDSMKESAALRETIDRFMSDVDSALSVSNALTTIDVEYESY